MILYTVINLNYNKIIKSFQTGAPKRKKKQQKKKTKTKENVLLKLLTPLTQSPS